MTTSHLPVLFADTPEPDIEFMWVYRPDLEARLAEGWKPCDGWQNAGHHLRYVFPLWRTVGA